MRVPFLSLVLALLTTSSPASAQSASPDAVGAPINPHELSAFLSVGWLTNTDANGAALDGGLRVALGRYAAFSIDMGYGVIASASNTQDRWWLIPSFALVIPLDAVRFDLGAGIGLGICSGYPDFERFASDPFTPPWAFQLVPTARAHVMASVQLERGLDGFVRFDAGTLLLEGNSIGMRDGNTSPQSVDTLWLHAAVGVSFRGL